MKTKWIIIVGLVALAGMAQAAFVTIGNAGNAADTANGGVYGDVAYTYKISDKEVTIAEMAAAIGAGDGDENYWNDGTRTVGTAAPAVRVSLYEAMKYCNYITSGDVNNGAYVFSGGVYQSTDRASAITTYGTVCALPTEDEWYKAAYFKSDASGYSLYANGTDTAPVAGTDSSYNGTTPWVVGTGTMEQNGTYDMMGNVFEWMEDSAGVIRGGGYFNAETYLRSSDRVVLNPSSVYNVVGFRPVEVVPEPATALSLVLGGLVVAGYRRIRKNYGL